VFLIHLPKCTYLGLVLFLICSVAARLIYKLRLCGAWFMGYFRRKSTSFYSKQCNTNIYRGLCQHYSTPLDYQSRPYKLFLMVVVGEFVLKAIPV